VEFRTRLANLAGPLEAGVGRPKFGMALTGAFFFDTQSEQRKEIMLDPSSLTILWIVWGAITVVFVALLIYRSLISMKEEDQIFLDPAEASLENEQREIVKRIQRLSPYVKGFGFASAASLVTIAGLYTYPVLKEFFPK
jgi:hypothetical protein